MNKIISLEVTVTKHLVYLREPEVYGYGPDNIMPTHTTTLVTIRYSDGTVVQQPSVPTTINIRTDGPGEDVSQSQVAV